MSDPLVPEDEEARLEKLDSLGIIYSPAEERFDSITKLARRVFDVPISLISLVTKDRQWFKSAQGIPISETPREISFCKHAILQDLTYIVPNALKDPNFADCPLVTSFPNIRFYAGHPIKYQGSNMGTLCIIDTVPREMTAPDVEALRNLARWVENEFMVTTLSAEQTRLLSERDEARREALVDPLTKVWNKKGTNELLLRETSNAKRKGSKIFLMILDIDHFKGINDKYGHLAGDKTLREVAQRIRTCIRPYDVIGRFGGDEFLFFAVDCTEKTGLEMAERILQRVYEKLFRVDDIYYPVSLSIGTAAAQATDDFEVLDLVKNADSALYRAKTAGRNCIRHKAMY
jgi:diguanylate cyclase (GGDEF)-like protein